MSSPELLARIETAKRTVLARTEQLHAAFGRASSMWKSDGTRVTEVDIAISEAIQSEVTAAFPEDQFFSEELTQAPAPIPVTARFVWILDPIDGTNNFALGIAHCAISLGLYENGQPVYGVVYDLSRRVLIHGGPGFGVFDGDRPASANPEPPTAQTLLGFHSPYDKRYLDHATTLVEHFKIRGLGSSTLHLAYVAVGILGGVVDHNVKIWDIAAAVPLCLGAGADVQFLNGPQFPLREFNLKMGRIFYLAGNPAVCARLRELMRVG